MVVRKLHVWEYKKALKLVMEVFMEFEAPDYTTEGIQSFRSTLSDWHYIRSLCIYGALEEHQLVGIIATRNEGSHIALFFVRKAYQKKGIGRKLFLEILKNTSKEAITVNSSPYATEIYHHLGFTDRDLETVTNGIRYTPMIRYPERYQEKYQDDHVQELTKE